MGRGEGWYLEGGWNIRPTGDRLNPEDLVPANVADVVGLAPCGAQSPDILLLSGSGRIGHDSQQP
jgi:hypothetical protein